jgi:protein-tyrosine kinase
MYRTDNYHKLAASLHQSQRERGTKVVMVASAAPGEGKSLTVANLARTLGQSYRRRVLAVDADLRLPVLHNLFGVPNERGLIEALDDPGADPEWIEVGGQVALLPAGHCPDEPLGALTSPGMREVLAIGARNFDWVIVDTPPVLLLPDSELVASMVDGVLFVVGANETDYRLAARAADAIGRQRILGVVLNKVDPDAFSPAYAYQFSGDARSHG